MEDDGIGCSSACFYFHCTLPMAMSGLLSDVLPMPCLLPVWVAFSPPGRHNTQRSTICFEFRIKFWSLQPCHGNILNIGAVGSYFTMLARPSLVSRLGRLLRYSFQPLLGLFQSGYPKPGTPWYTKSGQVEVLRNMVLNRLMNSLWCSDSPWFSMNSSLEMAYNTLGSA